MLIVSPTWQVVAKDILDLIQFVFVSRDNGDSNAEDAESWLPDTEPASVTADSWARGVVPTRRRVLQPEDPFEGSFVDKAAAVKKERTGHSPRAPTPEHKKDSKQEDKDKGAVHMGTCGGQALA